MAKLNEKVVGELAPPAKGNKVYYFAGAMLQGATAPRGFGVNVNYAGTRTFVLNYRTTVGRERRITLGRFPDWSALRAVREARELRQRVDRGEDPLAERKAVSEPAEAPKMVADVLEEHVRRHVGTLRTGHKVESALRRLAMPSIGQLGIYDVRRRHVAAMLDKVEDKAGPVHADR